jgi:hypothetical protein
MLMLGKQGMRERGREAYQILGEGGRERGRLTT